MVIKDVKNVDEQNTQQENVDDLIDEINKECNKEYLSAAIDRLILAMGKYLERKGELVEWNM